MLAKYLVRRLSWMLPTLVGITVACFFVINLAPGSPVEQELSRIRYGSSYHASAGVSDEVINAIKAQYGFDKPVYVRYLIWLKNIATLDFGESFSYQRPAITVVGEKAGLSFEFLFLAVALIYLISVPLGIFKAVRDGSAFDIWTTIGLLILYSTPTLVLGVMMRVFLAGGGFLNMFPLGYANSDDYATLSFWSQLLDRGYHMVLPLVCYVASGLTARTFLMKNSLLEEIRLDYVRTARAKGVGAREVIGKHALRNALIPIVTGLGSFISLYLAGAIVIEQIFNIDGLGLLSWRALMSRDYNVLMALIFMESVFAMVLRLATDIAYVFVDPRVDFK